MLQRQFFASAKRNGHHVKTNVSGKLARSMQINGGRIANLLDFAGRNRFSRRTESRSLLAAASYFYDDEQVRFVGNDVDFPGTAAPIPFYNRKSLRQQVLASELFRFSAEVFATVPSSPISAKVTQGTTLFPPFYRIYK
jgi:hypothetical protein